MKRTFGQIAVGLDFNPSGKDAVANMKQKYADIIDELHQLRMTTQSKEQSRWASVAITQAELAQMASVKSLTWKDYVPPAFDFETEVIERSHTVPVLVDFYLETCQPCHVIAPKLAALAIERGFDFVKLNAKLERGLSERFKVSSVPRLLIFAQGELFWDSNSGPWSISGSVDKVNEIITELEGPTAE